MDLSHNIKKRKRKNGDKEDPRNMELPEGEEQLLQQIILPDVLRRRLDEINESNRDDNQAQKRDWYNSSEESNDVPYIPPPPSVAQPKIWDEEDDDDDSSHAGSIIVNNVPSTSTENFDHHIQNKQGQKISEQQRAANENYEGLNGDVNATNTNNILIDGQNFQNLINYDIKMIEEENRREQQLLSELRALMQHRLERARRAKKIEEMILNERRRQQQELIRRMMPPMPIPLHGGFHGLNYLTHPRQSAGKNDFIFNSLNLAQESMEFPRNLPPSMDNSTTHISEDFKMQNNYQFIPGNIENTRRSFNNIFQSGQPPVATIPQFMAENGVFSETQNNLPVYNIFADNQTQSGQFLQNISNLSRPMNTGLNQRIPLPINRKFDDENNIRDSGFHTYPPHNIRNIPDRVLNPESYSYTNKPSETFANDNMNNNGFHRQINEIGHNQRFPQTQSNFQTAPDSGNLLHNFVPNNRVIGCKIVLPPIQTQQEPTNLDMRVPHNRHFGNQTNMPIKNQIHTIFSQDMKVHHNSRFGNQTSFPISSHQQPTFVNDKPLNRNSTSVHHYPQYIPQVPFENRQQSTFSVHNSVISRKTSNFPFQNDQRSAFNNHKNIHFNGGTVEHFTPKIQQIQQSNLEQNFHNFQNTENRQAVLTNLPLTKQPAQIGENHFQKSVLQNKQSSGPVSTEIEFNSLHQLLTNRGFNKSEITESQFKVGNHQKQYKPATLVTFAGTSTNSESSKHVTEKGLQNVIRNEIDNDQEQSKVISNYHSQNLVNRAEVPNINTAHKSQMQAADVIQEVNINPFKSKQDVRNLATASTSTVQNITQDMSQPNNDISHHKKVKYDESVTCDNKKVKYDESVTCDNNVSFVEHIKSQTSLSEERKISASKNDFQQQSLEIRRQDIPVKLSNSHSQNILNRQQVPNINTHNQQRLTTHNIQVVNIHPFQSRRDLTDLATTNPTTEHNVIMQSKSQDVSHPEHEERGQYDKNAAWENNVSSTDHTLSFPDKRRTPINTNDFQQQNHAVIIRNNEENKEVHENSTVQQHPVTQSHVLFTTILNRIPTRVNNSQQSCVAMPKGILKRS